ncbi:protein of unknown function [Methylocella tundrae]|uniref:Uncharacterized protein n=1 Tax=Methylocella tundrae TaxID=227605 RepID=A0A4U8Z7B1_METTU|nr:protein of unknown function [Methylocella tundrae]
MARAASCRGRRQAAGLFVQAASTNVPGSCLQLNCGRPNTIVPPPLIVIKGLDLWLEQARNLSQVEEANDQLKLYPLV